MEIRFPNPSRSYDEAGHGVHFWGYDKTFEILFFMQDEALATFDPEAQTNEAALLNAFDLNLARIREVAGNVYARRRKASYIYSYTLTGADFRNPASPA